MISTVCVTAFNTITIKMAINRRIPVPSSISKIYDGHRGPGSRRGYRISNGSRAESGEAVAATRPDVNPSS